MNEIKDLLYDLTKITKGPKFSVIKVTGTDEKTEFKSMTDDNTIIMTAKTKKPVKDFIGTFGLGNLDILRGYLDIYKSYDKDTPVDVSVNKVDRNGVSLLSDITFKAKGQSSANYRLIGENAIKKIAVLNAEIKWDVEIENLNKTKINEFIKFSNVMSGFEKVFTVSVRDEMLKFNIGGLESAVSRVEIDIAKVDKALKTSFSYPVSDYQTILINNDPVLKFSDKGLAGIFINSDLIEYEFYFPGRN